MQKRSNYCLMIHQLELITPKDTTHVRSTVALCSFISECSRVAVSMSACVYSSKRFPSIFGRVKIRASAKILARGDEFCAYFSYSSLDKVFALAPMLTRPKIEKSTENACYAVDRPSERVKAWPNGMQVDASLKTCTNLHRLAAPFGQGLSGISLSSEPTDLQVLQGELGLHVVLGVSNSPAQALFGSLALVDLLLYCSLFTGSSHTWINEWTNTSLIQSINQASKHRLTWSIS